jgi:hypothetical protein
MTSAYNFPAMEKSDRLAVKGEDGKQIQRISIEQTHQGLAGGPALRRFCTLASGPKRTAAEVGGRNHW